MSRGTILLVDDDYDVRAALADLLVFIGFSVTCAADGDEALGLLEGDTPPALILLDWMMPRCDGATFRTRQLANARWAAIPVVVLTADRRVVDRSVIDPRLDYLPKPIDVTRLLAIIDQRLPASAD
jgi:CheY-like chemotaxis protein